MKSSTWLCGPCDVTSRAGTLCQHCGAPMANMGSKWSPGRKGSRTRLWDGRRARRAVQTVPPPRRDPYKARPVF